MFELSGHLILQKLKGSPAKQTKSTSGCYRIHYYICYIFIVYDTFMNLFSTVLSVLCIMHTVQNAYVPVSICLLCIPFIHVLCSCNSI